MNSINKLSDKFFSIIPISEYDHEISFRSEKAPGLEKYLKNNAQIEDMINRTRTYLIIDRSTKEIVAYFTLKTGLITEPINYYRSSLTVLPYPMTVNSPFKTLSAIELTNIAINDFYKNDHTLKKQFMAYLLDQFILPVIDIVQKYIGIEYLYLFALPHEKLIQYYERLGFMNVPLRKRHYYNQHIRPQYDDNCIFMYTRLSPPTITRRSTNKK